MSISKAVQAAVESNANLYELLSRGLANYTAVAEELKPRIEKSLGKEVKLPAVMMALRRLAERLDKRDEESFDFSSEIIMKSPLCDIAVETSPEVLGILKTLYAAVDPDHGDTFHVLHGNYEVTIVTNERHMAKVKQHLEGHRIMFEEKGLVSLSLRFKGDFIGTPGVVARVTRQFAWEGINIYEIISSFSELIIIVHSKDATRGYNTLSSIISS